jgi:hypothetical protein
VSNGAACSRSGRRGFSLARRSISERRWCASIAYRRFLPHLHLDTLPKLVQYIKLGAQKPGLGAETVRVPWLPLVDSEREQIVRLVCEPNAARPVGVKPASGAPKPGNGVRFRILETERRTTMKFFPQTPGRIPPVDSSALESGGRLSPPAASRLGSATETGIGKPAIAVSLTRRHLPHSLLALALCVYAGCSQSPSAEPTNALESEFQSIAKSANNRKELVELRKAKRKQMRDDAAPNANQGKNPKTSH